MNVLQGVPQSALPQLPLFLGFIVLGVYVFYWIFVYYIQSDHTETDRCIIYIAGFSLTMFFWSFRRAVCFEPGYVPIGSIEEDNEQLAGITPEEKKAKRYCLPCKIFKPERSHHCSQCRRCVLNMDHHCVWTANCIGLHNRKAFNLVLQWGTFSLFLGAFFGIRYLPRTLSDIIYDSNNDEFLWLFIHMINLFIIVGGCTNAIGLLFFAKKHVMFILNNITTLDDMRGEQISPYSFGWLENYKFYFGQSPLIWLIPIGDPIGDGFTWNKNNSTNTSTNDEEDKEKADEDIGSW